MDTNNNENLDSVLKKLQKLQKLYDSAKEVNSEGEAEAAAIAIQRLLTLHNLSMEDIKMDDENVGDNMIHLHISGENYSCGGWWEERLTSVVCSYSFCKCYYYGNSYKRLLVVGKKENVENVLWMTKFLSEKFVKLSEKRWNEYRMSEEYSINKITKHKFQRNYLIGCTDGLNAKMKAEREYEKQNLGEKVTSLVVCNDSMIKKYVNENIGRSRTSKRTFGDQSSARNIGYTDGRMVQINKQIDSNNVERRISL